MYPANSHVIRPATPDAAHALRKLATTAGKPPLAGRIVVIEVRGAVAAAISRDDSRTIADPAAPAYLTMLLRLRVAGLTAVDRQPDLRERLLEAVRGPREREQLPLAA